MQDCKHNVFRPRTNGPQDGKSYMITIRISKFHKERR